MKILYLRTLYWFDLKAGGSVGHTAGVINALDKKVDLHVVSNDNLAEVKKEIEILKPIFLPFVPKEISEFFYNFKVINHCKEMKSDVIYQRYNGFSFCGAYLAKQKSIPFVLEFNSSDVWKIKHWKSNEGKLKKIARYIYNKLFKLLIVSFVENYNLKNASYIIVVSDALKNTLLGFGVEERKIIVNPNGVDETKYHPNKECGTIKRKYSLQNRVVLGFIGTFGQWHGAELIAKAYGELLLSYPPLREKTRLLMVGDGVRMNNVRQIIKEYDINEYVVMVGLVPQNQGAKYLAACDILVNSTTANPDGSEFFGSPTKVFEYMAMGKAVICSDIGQMSNILEHNKTAFLVKPDDAQELMIAMKVLIDSPDLRNNLGFKAREEAVNKYTWEQHSQKIIYALDDSRSKYTVKV